jgi:hypothetical protein
MSTSHCSQTLQNHATIQTILSCYLIEPMEGNFSNASQNRIGRSVVSEMRSRNSKATLNAPDKSYAFDETIVSTAALALQCRPMEDDSNARASIKIPFH